MKNTREYFQGTGKVLARNGFTLLELLVTISIVGILAGIAIPSFKSSIASNRLTTYANQFVTTLNLARSEAIRQGKTVTVKRKGATSGQWESGWDMFVDLNGDGTFTDANSTPCETTTTSGIVALNEDCKLKTANALVTGSTLRVGTSTTYKDYIVYLPSGLSTVVAGDAFVLCSTTGTAQERRTITIGPTGRPGVTVTTGTCP